MELVKFEVIVMTFLMNRISGNSLHIYLIIGAAALLLIGGLVILLIFNSKKKRCRDLLDVLRTKIHNLKETEAILNYSTYDNLKNDEKLGMLVMRWKKSIEILVREVDAQYSMLDVLDDSIISNKFKNFYTLYQQVDKDVKGLENRANELNDEIAEYINKASDNRKYISKYQEMYHELKEQYQQNKKRYEGSQASLLKLMEAIEEAFTECQTLIKNSQFEEADATASYIFDQIKHYDHLLEVLPKYDERLIEEIKPKYQKLSELKYQFNETELQMIDTKFIQSFQANTELINQIENDIKNLTIEETVNHLEKCEEFLDHYSERLSTELNSKNYIIHNMNYQKEYLTKIENTAKNFISVFRMVSSSYTEKDLKNIEEIILEVDQIKGKLQEYEDLFDEKQTSFEILKKKLEETYQGLTKISKYLDENIRVIDEIYSDEKIAREKIALMTEKINGTKKFITYANLGTKEEDLKVIKHLNQKLTEIYVLLSDFPIDIVKLNELIDAMINKVEKMTKDINNQLYKALLTEYAILYANRYFKENDYRNDILSAENHFYNQNMGKAYDKIMSLFERIDPNIKRVVLEKYQTKFNALFN
jgi:septation ring formation regulator